MTSSYWDHYSANRLHMKYKTYSMNDVPSWVNKSKGKFFEGQQTKKYLTRLFKSKVNQNYWNNDKNHLKNNQASKSEKDHLVTSQWIWQFAWNEQLHWKIWQIRHMIKESELPSTCSRHLNAHQENFTQCFQPRYLQCWTVSCQALRKARSITYKFSEERRQENLLQLYFHTYIMYCDYHPVIISQ